jgi:uncharacterized protein involved in exopolysaccharide biosynthesis
MAYESHVGYENGGFPYSLRDLLTIVFKRRWLILAILFAMIAVVLVRGLTQPRTYRVSTTLLVNEARAEMPIAPTDSGSVIINRVTQEDLNSEIQVLKSRKLIEDVVVRLTDQKKTDATPGENNEGDVLAVRESKSFEDERQEVDTMVLHLQAALDISAVPRSNVLQIVYRSSDPAWATTVVKTFVDEYLEQRAERYGSPQAVVFFEHQMNDAQARLRRHEHALEEFVDEASITLVDGPVGTDALAAQKNLVMGRLSKLENDLGDAEAYLQEQTHQISRLRTQLANEPERLRSASRYNRDATIEEIERRLAELRLERDALLQDFKADSRYVRDIENQIRMAEQRISDYEESRLAIDGTEINPVYLELKGELLRAEAGLDGAAAKVSSLQSQVAEHKLVLNRLNDHAFELGRLSRETAAAKEDYLLYRKKHEEARISAAMDRERFINVTIAQPAQTPLKPEPRGLRTKAVLALLIGLLGGVGIAFTLEQYVVRSFTTGEDIERRLGITHIASIPEGESAG